MNARGYTSGGVCMVAAALVAQFNGPVALAASAELSEVIVTAERREQDVQKAPLTIQVLGSEQLASSGLSDASGLQRLTTGVEIGMGGANSQIFIRGVGNASFSPLSSPGVAFNVDGVYVGRPDGVNGNFYDVARVEVLKGPQGTLYGRNANGGSINLITNEPRLGALEGSANAEVGNYQLVHTGGAINLPIAGTAALRGAFNIVHRNGYLSDGTNDDVQQSGRLRFKWERDENVSLNLSADYTHLGGKGGDYVYLPRRPGSSPYEAQTTPEANAYMHGILPLGPLHDNVVANNHQDTTLYNVSGQLDWKLGSAKLTVIPALRHVDSNYITHIANLYESHVATRQQSLETRLGGSASRVDWVVGGYFFDEKSDNGLVTVRVSNILQNFLISYSPDTKAYAGFGQGTFKVTDDSRIIAGVRYTSETQVLTGTLKSAATTPPTLLENFGGRKTFDGTTYKIGVEHDLRPESLLFLTYSTGFKAGGFSQTVAPLNVFQPERLKAFEIGSRNRFLDNRLQVNLGAYHWKYSELQDARVNFDPLGNVNFITFNSGAATIYGATLDILAKPTAADTVSLLAEYTHSKYDSYFFQTPVPFFLPGSSGCKVTGPFAPGATLPYTAGNGSNRNDGPLPVIVGDCSAFQVARVPQMSGTFAYSHVFTLANAATVSFEGSVKFAGARWLGIDFIPSERDGSYSLVDASLTYSAADNRWSVGVFGRNIADSVYYTGGIQTAFLGGVIGANIAPPRTYGIRGSFSFDATHR